MPLRRGLNDTNIFARVDKAEIGRNETAKVILNREEYPSYEPNGIYNGKFTYYGTLTVDTPRTYRRDCDIGFENLGDDQARIQTTPKDNEVVRLLEGKTAFINILPTYMDPRRIG